MEEIKRVHHKTLIVAVCLLLIIMAFTGFVNFMSFSDNYNNSLVNTYSVAGQESVRKIEYAIHYGKPIDNYYGMNDMLKELKDVIPEVEQVKIVSPGGDVLYDINGFVGDSQLPGELEATAGFKQGNLNENLSYQFYGDKAYIFIRINDNNLHHVASIMMVFPKSSFLQFNSYYSKQLVGYLVLIGIIALILLAIIFFKTDFIKKDRSMDKKRVLIVFIVVLGSAQLLYSGVNYLIFKNAYIDMAYKSRDFIENIMEKNIEDVYSKGLSLQDIEGFDEYLNSIKDSLPEIEDVSLVPSRELNLQNAHNLSKIKATVSAEYINQQMLRIILDLLTVLVISILFMIEITLLAVIIMTRDRSKAKSDQEIDPDVRTSHGLVRSLVFFVNLSGCMALTFIPVVMNSIYQPFMGLPKDVILGLPLSAEMLGGVLAIILAGRLIDRKGWRSVLFIGVLFLAVGNLLSGLSSTVLPYILSRAVAGLGLGYILMTTRSLAVSLPERNLAIAEFGAGSIAGLNCGAVIGGMLADRLGYDAVFFLAAVSAIVPFIFVRRLMIGFEIEKRETSDVSALAKFVNIIADKKAIIFLACIFIPFFISGAFLDYFFPLLLSSNDFSQSDISRGVLLYGLFIIYLGPVLTKLSTEKLGTTNGIIVSMIIVISGLATFMLFGTVAAAFVTIICLGIAESFGVSLETSYFLNLKGIKDLEINKGVAYFSFLVNLSRMAGPIVYGMALLLGMKMGVGVISLVLIVLLFGFIFSIRYMRSQSNTLEVS